MQMSNNIAIVLPDVLPSSEKEDYMHGCCHIFALALAELTGLKIAAIIEKRGLYLNEEKNISSISMYRYRHTKESIKVYDIKDGLVHATCLIDNKSDLIFDALGIRSIDSLNIEFDTHEETNIHIFDNPNDILKYGHTFGERNKDVEDYVRLTKDYINTYLTDELEQLKGRYGTH